jgi:Uncharacterised nucleotidyltransferase
VSGSPTRAVTADERRLLAAALRPVGPGGGAASAPAWNRRAWDGPAGPGALHLAAAHDLLPALWRAEVERGTWTELPPEALEVVRARFRGGTTQPALLAQQAHEANRARVADLVDQGDLVLAALAQAGVEAVPLKGLHALRAGWWADPASRVMRDLDILVDDAQAAAAEAVLLGSGYVPLASGHDDYGDHERPALHRPGRDGSVELHTALVVSRWRAVLPASEVLSAGPPLSSTDAVIHSIAHAQLHDEAHLLARMPWRALHELAVVAGGHRGPEIDWDRVRRQFTAVGAAAALDAHLWLAIDLFDAAVPRPARTWRPRLHQQWSEALLAHPAWAPTYESAVFAPRALSAPRMHQLHGEGPLWALRGRHVASAVSTVVAGRIARMSAGRGPRPGRRPDQPN